MPIIGAVMAMIIFKEISYYHLLGAILIIAGTLYLIKMSNEQEK